MGVAKSGRVRRGQSEWACLVEEQSHSGLSVPAFCRERGVGYQSFLNWRKRLAGDAGETGATQSGSKHSQPEAVDVVSFHEVRVVEAAPLEIGCGPFTVRVPAGLQEDELRRVLRILSSAVAP